MRITLQYNGVIDIRKFTRGEQVELPGHATAATLMDTCEIRPQHQAHVIPFINGVEGRASSALHDGDEVSLFLPLGGG